MLPSLEKAIIPFLSLHILSIKIYMIFIVLVSNHSWRLKIIFWNPFLSAEKHWFQRFWWTENSKIVTCHTFPLWLISKPFLHLKIFRNIRIHEFSRDDQRQIVTHLELYSCPANLTLSVSRLRTKRDHKKWFKVTKNGLKRALWKSCEFLCLKYGGSKTA